MDSIRTGRMGLGPPVIMADYRKRIYDKYVSFQTQAWENWSPDAYRLWSKGAARRVKGWLPADKNASCLDLACGPGNFLFFLQEAGYRDLNGIDLSPEQVQQAKRVCPQANILLGDLSEFLKAHPARFDLVSGLDIIEHLKKDEILGFLDDVHRALKPGGILILQTPNAASPFFGDVAHGDFTHEWFFAPDGLKRILNMTGFHAFQARECGPYPHGPLSAFRFVLWKIMSVFLRLFDLIETGGSHGIHTRVFIARAHKGGEQTHG
jgi:2-polyprenyl-3-methyl-5-hydroxy-6-metoxy-1,4-benzoquinol methylase